MPYILAILFLSSACSAVTPPADQVIQSEAHHFRFELLAERDGSVWGFDFLDKNRMIFTERSGTVGILDLQTKIVTPLSGAPKVAARGQGGMLDVRVHPTQKSRIYLTYSEPGEGRSSTTAFSSAVLEGAELKNFKKYFSAHAPNSGTQHFGSRIEFDGNGHIFITVGDRGERSQVQDLGYHIGSVLRFREDGSVPKDNPFLNRKGARPEIWAYGVRSPQGLALRPGTDELWLADMGPRGGDELNLIKKGLNYGWPEVTLGREYHGPSIGEKSKPGMIDPVAHWVPSISPSAFTFYSGDKFSAWKGNGFLANLSGTHLRRLVFEGQKVVKQEALLEDVARFRNVRTGPEGFLYVSTDDGRIGRLVPAN